jgi:hypothetical protein
MVSTVPAGYRKFYPLPLEKVKSAIESPTLLKDKGFWFRVNYRIISSTEVPMASKRELSILQLVGSRDKIQKYFAVASLGTGATDEPDTIGLIGARVHLPESEAILKMRRILQVASTALPKAECGTTFKSWLEPSEAAKDGEDLDISVNRKPPSRYWQAVHEEEICVVILGDKSAREVLNLRDVIRRELLEFGHTALQMFPTEAFQLDPEGAPRVWLKRVKLTSAQVEQVHKALEKQSATNSAPPAQNIGGSVESPDSPRR